MPHPTPEQDPNFVPDFVAAFMPIEEFELQLLAAIRLKVKEATNRAPSITKTKKAILADDIECAVVEAVGCDAAETIRGCFQYGQQPFKYKRTIYELWEACRDDAEWQEPYDRRVQRVAMEMIEDVS